MPSAHSASRSILPGAGEDPVLDQILDAALRCVSHAGFDRTTIRDIVRESGVARTTIYRKLGNRDVILAALLARMTVPHHQRCEAIAAGPGTLPERLEMIIIAAITSIDAYPWLKALLRGGLSEHGLAIFDAARRFLGSDILRSIIQAVADEAGGSLPVTLDEIMHWLVRQILMLAGERFDDKAMVVRHVSCFIMPVLSAHTCHKPAPQSLGDELMAIRTMLELLVDNAAERSPKPPAMAAVRKTSRIKPA